MEDADLEVFFEHQKDPEATGMAVFPARGRDAFTAHWTKIRVDVAVLVQAIVADGQVAGNIGSWEDSGKRMVGYWLGRRHWGRGIATKALRLFLDQEESRPLYACVAAHNAGSIRVLEKAGFRTVTAQESRPSSAEIGDVVFILGS